MNPALPLNLEMRKFVAPEFIFGLDARKLVLRYIKNLSLEKIFIASDKGIQKAGWTDEILQLLKDSGIQHELFVDISPNPRDYEVMKGASFYKEKECDSVLAIGGGSVLDFAKGVGIVVSNGGNILDYEGIDKILYPMPPLICIPTTGGTSADVSQFAIINDSNRKVKIAIISKSVVPDVSLIDPLVLTSMDSYLTACTGIDALVHSIEAYVSNASSAFTDLYALESIKIIKACLIPCLHDLKNVDLRGKIMLASLYAGLAFSNASLGCVHSMAHSLGGYLDLPHGECNALLLPFVSEFNYDYAASRYDDIAEIFDFSFRTFNASERKKQLTEILLNFRKSAGITSCLKEKGITQNDLSILAEKALNDPCTITNPRKPTLSDLKHIYLRSF